MRCVFSLGGRLTGRRKSFKTSSCYSAHLIALYHFYCSTSDIPNVARNAPSCFRTPIFVTQLSADAPVEFVPVRCPALYLEFSCLCCSTGGNELSSILEAIIIPNTIYNRPLNVNIFQKTILNTHEKNAFFGCFWDPFFCTMVRKAAILAQNVCISDTQTALCCVYTLIRYAMWPYMCHYRRFWSICCKYTTYNGT